MLKGLEHEALEAKKGLWADLQPVPPWEWRKRKGRCRALSTVKSSMFSGLNNGLIAPWI